MDLRNTNKGFDIQEAMNHNVDHIIKFKFLIHSITTPNIIYVNYAFSLLRCLPFKSPLLILSFIIKENLNPKLQKSKPHKTITRPRDFQILHSIPFNFLNP